MTDEEKKEELAKIAKRRALFQGQGAVAKFVDGETEDVKVRQFRLSEVESLDFMSTVLNGAQCLDTVCDKPEGWSDTLDPDSFDELYALALEVNHPTLLRLKDRGKIRTKALSGDSKSPNQSAVGATSS